MPEGLRSPILPGGRARGGNGNCRWVRRATPIPTEPAMGSELEPNAQLGERRQCVSLGGWGPCVYPFLTSPHNPNGQHRTQARSEQGFPKSLHYTSLKVGDGECPPHPHKAVPTLILRCNICYLFGVRKAFRTLCTQVRRTKDKQGACYQDMSCFSSSGPYSSGKNTLICWEVFTH